MCHVQDAGPGTKQVQCTHTHYTPFAEQAHSSACGWGVQAANRLLHDLACCTHPGPAATSRQSTSSTCSRLQPSRQHHHQHAHSLKRQHLHDAPSWPTGRCAAPCACRRLIPSPSPLPPKALRQIKQAVWQRSAAPKEPNAAPPPTAAAPACMPLLSQRRALMVLLRQCTAGALPDRQCTAGALPDCRCTAGALFDCQCAAGALPDCRPAQPMIALLWSSVM